MTLSSERSQRQLRRLIPRPLRDALRPLYYRLYHSLPEPPRVPESKYEAEVAFWKHYQLKHGFGHDHYRGLMLAVAGERDASFLRGKVVGDFGCGPMGSLAWANEAALRIGIDVLVGPYADAFGDAMVRHGMIYVQCTEVLIPLCPDLFDVVFTINSMDHTNNFPAICSEILRVLKPGGLLVASLNLNMQPTRCEPQRLTEDFVRKHLLQTLKVESYRLARIGPGEDPYALLKEGRDAYRPGEPACLWVRARKGQA